MSVTLDQLRKHLPRRLSGAALDVAALGKQAFDFAQDTHEWLRKLSDLIAAQAYPASYQATPSDPTGTTNTTGKMAGLAARITPAATGRVYIVIAGNGTNSGATAGQGVKTLIRYGTGASPANGASLLGTTAGSTVTATLMAASADLIPISVSAIVSGLIVGTSYWFDVQQAALTGGTGQLKNLSVSIVEF